MGAETGVLTWRAGVIVEHAFNERRITLPLEFVEELPLGRHRDPLIVSSVHGEQRNGLPASESPDRVRGGKQGPVFRIGVGCEGQVCPTA